MKFRFVQEHRETFRVGMMGKVPKVSRSGYYAWRQRQPSRREREDRELAGRILSALTLDRAKKAAGVEARPRMNGTRKHWWWSLPREEGRQHDAL